MKKILYLQINRIVLLIIMVAFVFCFFSGCMSANNNDANQSDSNKNNDIENSDTNQNNSDTFEKITLNSFNYEEYFVVQEEILSFDYQEYTVSNTRYVSVTQLTKIYIVPLKRNMIFENVEFKVLVNDIQYKVVRLGYDGAGSITISDIYTEKYLSWLRQPRTHTIFEVKGSISFDNR